MAKTPKKVMVIGLDCALPHLIEKHIKEGHLPVFKNLIDKGVIADNCLTNYPTITPPNWATIATGAWAGTHGVTDFHVHEPGTDLDNSSIRAAFSSERVKAEYIWDAADQAGKKCIVVNYPGSWPSKMKNGIMVGGEGLTTGEHRDGHWGLESDCILSSMELITTGLYPMSVRRSLKPAEGWENVPDAGSDPLEMQYDLSFRRARYQSAPLTWWILVRDTQGQGYDRVTLSPTRDYQDAFCTLAVGEWSEKIYTTVKMADGSEKKVFFRCKLLELSDDADDFRLYVTELCQTTGWSDPPEIAAEITSEEGIFGHGGGLGAYPIGWFGLDTYIEINEMHDAWLGDVVTTLLKSHEWDLFYMHSHPPDWVYHAIISDMDPNTCPDEEKRKAAWDTHLKIYQSQDRLLGRIMEQAGKDTLVILVSDHGATPDGPAFNPYKVLVPAGLCAEPKPADAPEMAGYVAKALKEAALRPDPKESQAIPQRSIYVYINLKGRDPDGIVPPEDYEKVQQEVIDALLNYVEPGTGKRPVALALTKQDARILGLYGDRVGDVVYALYPEFGSQHGQILPTGEWGVGSLKGLFVMHGPGLKKGYRLQRNMWLNDVAATVCYLLDLPVPEQCEGAVLYQAFKDPNFKLKEINKLRDALGRMETAVARQEREPWDKHDCA